MRGQAFVTFPSIELAHRALVCLSRVLCFPVTREFVHFVYLVIVAA